MLVEQLAAEEVIASLQEKFKPFNFKSLLGKKKKDQKRNVSSVDSKKDISSANGLSNFQKVSRHYKAKYPVFLGTKVQQAYKTF